MYCPAHFEETRSDVLDELIHARPLATLITQTASGLNADLIPLQRVVGGQPPAMLLGHVARANPMWKSARTDIEALAIFQGPAAYISPSWYPGKKVDGKAVPTWNYVVVEARGKLRFVDDKAWLRAQVEALTAQQESTFAEPWAVSDAPADYVEKMLAAIVGVEMTITSIKGKWKLSQNQPAPNRLGAAAGLNGVGSEAARAVAALIERP